MPAGQLSFLLRAGSDTLPTLLNLLRWRLRPDAKCPLCDNPWPTVQHILNGCPVSLSQGRYTWRHDRALKILANGLRKCLQPGERLYADLPEMRATDVPPTTIQAEILDTSACPDIVIVRASEIILIELTVLYNSPDCLHNARLRKGSKEIYQHALSDLETRGMRSELVTIEIEIGALGHWLPHTCSSLRLQISSLSKSAATHLLDSTAKCVITASNRIFCARFNPSWNSTQPFC